MRGTGSDPGWWPQGEVEATQQAERRVRDGVGRGGGAAEGWRSVPDGPA